MIFKKDLTHVKKWIKKNLGLFLPYLGFLLKYFIKKSKNKINILIKEKGVFFGYYDISPFNNKNTRLLLNICEEKYFETPQKCNYLKLAYYDFNKQTIVRFGESNTWCWQQGCRLQFYPANNNDHIIFNNIVKDDYGAIILNLITRKEIKQINYPIYSVDSEGNFALSLNFSRLQRLRPGYGYSIIPDKTINSLCPEDDGVFQIDITNNSSSLIVSLKTLFEHKTEPTMYGASHYVNHLLYSPDNSKFLFFHIWNLGSKRYSRPFIYYLNEEKLQLLDKNSLAVSHYTFRSNDELLLTVKDKKIGLVYKLYCLKEGNIDIIHSKYLTKDSHPSFVDSNKLLYDTYPNLLRFSDLSIINLITNENKRIDRNFHPKNFSGEFRCDLHPRLNFNKDKICIDTIKKNRRIIKIIKIK